MSQIVQSYLNVKHVHLIFCVTVVIVLSSKHFYFFFFSYDALFDALFIQNVLLRKGTIISLRKGTIKRELLVWCWHTTGQEADTVRPQCCSTHGFYK